MAYQKLQVGLGINVIPSATINIPNVAGPTQGKTVTSVSGLKLVDSGGGFTDNLLGSIVYNTTNNTIATVVAVDSSTQLSLSANIFTVSGNAYVIYGDDNPGCVLYVGGAGDLHVLTSSDSDITFTGVLAGSFIPVQVKRVFNDSTASNILALW